MITLTVTMFYGMICAFCILIVYIWLKSKVCRSAIWSMFRSQEKCLITITKRKKTKRKPSDSQRSIEATNHLLSTNKSNNTNQDHIISQKEQLSISSNALSNITEEDVSLNVLKIARDDIQIDTVFSGRQSPIQEDTTCNTITSSIDSISNDSLFISNLNNDNRIDIESQKKQLYKEEDTLDLQCFAETNNVTLLQKKPWNYDHISKPIKQTNIIYSSRSKENLLTLKNQLDIIRSNNDNQDNIIFQEEQLFETGKSKTLNTICQEDIVTTSLIDTVPQAHQPIAEDTSGHLLYHKNIAVTYYFSPEESDNQEPVNLINYNSQAEIQFNKEYNNQLNKQFSNQTNKLIIDSLSQQIFLKLSLLNKGTTRVLPTLQIPTKIVRKEERSNQQSSIKLSIDSSKYKADKMLKRVKIIIVGAGASGIAAASRLLQEGISDFVVLEANDRIGGRINTVDFGDNAVDLGAQWVHGETGNVVCELAYKYNLLGSFCTFFDASKHEFFTINGERIPKEESVEALTIYYDMMKGAPDELSITDGSFGDYFRKKFYQVCTKKTFANYKRIPQFFSWMEKAECSIECSDSLSDVSAKRLADYWECKGDSVQNWKERGYKTLFDLLMKKIPNEEDSLPVMEKIEYHKVVTTIDYSSEENVTVTTSDGCKYIASHVIFTASLGVLKKKHSTLFMPCLPPRKKRAIRGLSIGTADKIFMEFPYKWWSEDTIAINLICLEENKKLFVQKYGEEYQWLCDVFSFYTVDYQPRVLCAWIVGKYARHMETLSDSVVSDGLYRLLQESIGKYYDVIQPTKILRSKWFTDEHFQGSYTFQSMNTEDLNVTPKDLAEPIVIKGKPVILFAGEATHDHYYSTVHGAVETGFREADRLLDFNQRKRGCLDLLVQNINKKMRLNDETMDEPMETYDERTKIVIVGAGIAGIAAAATLQKAGYDFIIFEAQDRIGGRIHSVPLKNGWIEFGAQYLHGDKGNLADYCYEKNLLSDFHGTDGEGLYLRDNGCAISAGTILACEVNDNIYDTLHSGEQFYQAKDANDYISKGESVGSYLRKNFDQYLFECNDPPQIRKMKEEIFDFKMRYLQVDNSCDSMYDLSVKMWGKYETSGSDRYQMFKEGYISILNNLMEDISSEKLRLNCPVKSIRWRDSIESRSDSAILLETCQGKRILADAVIVTCSLGVLKHVHEEMFDPPLPRSLSRAIENLGFGVVNKIILRYDAPWWYPTVTGFQILPNHDRPEFEPLPKWTTYITGFDVLHSHKNILVGWISGEGARAIEQIPEETVKSIVTTLLSRYMNRPIPLPADCFTSKWFTNEYIRGGYCNITTSCETAGVSTTTLSEPVWAKVKTDPLDQIPVLLLAGEATHDHYFSTVHGAYETGINQANLCVLFHKDSM
ncbi:uncharacterized protein LOC116844858 isoform X2 [Odontomachus brunneus]|uniref:uncharacterized protein LOC116844858 isoform X2 n=1 Tax=Odontomachus brunneus TaxID=486640 RepID=UPI0013F2A17D|nr:uncharacterized protein LOC116844858 isoform X2 [Odontomachus brunneus]